MRTTIAVAAFFIFGLTFTSVTYAEPIPILGFNIGMTKKDLQEYAKSEGWHCPSDMDSTSCMKHDQDRNVMMSVNWSGFDKLKYIYMQCDVINACQMGWEDLANAMEERFKVKFDITQSLQSKYIRSAHVCAEGTKKDLLCIAINESKMPSLVMLDRHKFGAGSATF